MKKLAITILCILATSYLQAQEKPTLTESEIKILVTSLADSVNRVYVNEAKAKLMSKNLLQKLADGKYNELKTPGSLSAELTSNLISWSNDKHFYVSFQPVGSSVLRQTQPRNVDHLAYYNYYFDKLEVLPGNIGYMELKQFVWADAAGYLIASAMSYLANTDGIIIDLRKNIGGSPDLVALLAGYFFEKPILFHSSHVRSTNTTMDLWTSKASVDFNLTTQNNNTRKLKAADVQRLANIPVYILTSSKTFSSAELFAYNMQAQNRVTIVGERTGGGGNGIRPFRLPSSLSVNIPFVEGRNPITKGNWEAVGVKPTIETSANNALFKAHINLIDSLSLKAKTEQEKIRLKWDAIAANALYDAYKPSLSELKNFEGVFGNRTFYVKNGELNMQTASGTQTLTYLSKDLFALNDITRIKFEKIDRDNKYNQLKVLLVEGNETLVERSK
jgi:hypothetical protein